MSESILDHIGAILDLSKENGIDQNFFENAKTHIDYIAEKLQITPIQAVLFAHIVDNSVAGQSLQPRRENGLINSLKCSRYEYLKYLNEIDELAKLNYVSKTFGSGYEGAVFRCSIPRDILFALIKERPIKPANYKNISIEKLFSRLGFIFNARYNNELTVDELFDELEFLIQHNTHLVFIKKILSYELKILERNLLIFFCHHEINNKMNVNIKRIQSYFSDSEEGYSNCKGRIAREKIYILQNLSLIENANAYGFGIREEFTLTEKARDELLMEIRDEEIPNKKDVIKASNIKEKQLFYNSGEAEQIKKLAGLLLPDNFKHIAERLSEQGLRTGFACLFSGPPGTGKTETAYQIARQSGRDLLQTDVSQIKDMWVGGSEKNIKALFARYRRYVKRTGNAPILFFNEADAIISRRMELGPNSRAADQMENSIQNIILQEMENLDGILIATTNLTKNIDKAFDRRFLYKIEFKKPEIQVRKSIWKSMLPDLSDRDAFSLSSNFDFSGGQIENIVRKRIVDTALYGKKPDIAAIAAYCHEELAEKTQCVIGFNSKTAV